jgi:hypothetical protein
MHLELGGGDNGAGGGGGGLTGFEHSTTIATRFLTFLHGSPHGTEGLGLNAGPKPQVLDFKSAHPDSTPRQFVISCLWPEIATVEPYAVSVGGQNFEQPPDK